MHFAHAATLGQLMVRSNFSTRLTIAIAVIRSGGFDYAQAATVVLRNCA